jgi:AhpD family alkylhydroperoxidase
VARIDPLEVRDWPPEMRDALAALRPSEVRHELPRTEGRPKALNALGTLARYPALTKAFHTFNGHILFASHLTPRQRELLVLRVAVRRDCEYEWAQHSVLASDAGLTEDEIARVTDGPDAPGWAAADRALLAAADELVDSACISDATWARLASELDERQLMDVVFTVGAYEVLAMAFRSFGVDIDADLAPYVRERPSQ